MIDPTVTVGNIIEIGTILVGGIFVFFQVKARVEQLSRDVAAIEMDIKGLSRSFTELAVVNNRLNRVEEDVRELRHGRGFIREAIEGEYPRVRP